MEQAIDHDALDAALRRCGSSWDAAQTHGLLSGRLATGGADSGFGWLTHIIDAAAADDEARSECETMLGTLFETTYRQLSERLSEFQPLLPDDDDSTAVRAAALGRWCEGFLHGLVSARHSAVLRERLVAEPVAGIIRDMLEITRASTDDDGDDEADEVAYAEIVEYLRVAAQITYEELADVRRGGRGEEVQGSGDALH